MSDFTAGKPTPKLTGRIADVRGRQWSTHRSRRRFSERATGLPWNLTFADAAEKVTVGESGHSYVAITDLCKVPAERPHPKAAYARCRPSAVLRLAEPSGGSAAVAAARPGAANSR